MPWSHIFFSDKGNDYRKLLFVQSDQCYRCKKPQQLPQYYFKTNISNLIFIRMLFLHTNKSKKNKDPDFLYIYKTIIEVHLLDKNAKLVSLHKTQLQFEDTSYLPLLPAKSASSESFHFMRNINSPLLSEPPIIHSGSRPLAKPLGLSAASLFFFDLLSSDSLSDKDFPFVPSFYLPAF